MTGKKVAKKYIHYCWFGDHELSRLAKRCIESWKKYLPDYEIICWNEDNIDINECAFVKEAYEKKKWAFVADYFRAKAMYEYGGIYFDTDMEIKKDITSIIKRGDFIGVEDSGAIAVGVWGAKSPGSDLAKELLDFYRSQKSFNDKSLYSITIPVIVTRILSKYGFKRNCRDVQELKNGVFVYPREYFYPLSYNYHDNDFTDNTCMVHYYDASWAPKGERRAIWQIRKFGPKNYRIMQEIKYKIKALFIYYYRVIWRTIELFTYPVRIIKKCAQKKTDVLLPTIERIMGTNNTFIAFAKEGWLGVGSSTQEMFGSVTYVPDIDDEKRIDDLVDAIIKNKKIRMVIFSGFATGWEKIVRKLKKEKPDLVVKVFWHGSNAMHIEEYDWGRFSAMMTLLGDELIDEVAFAKKSMYEQYSKLGYKVVFLPNNYSCKLKVKRGEKRDDDKKRIGIYSSGDRWVKNFYNQMAAASLIKNAKVDIVPISPRVAQFARLLNLNLSGEEGTIPRRELLARIARQDVVLYATFVECAPILPLECLEMGVPCITGDNHHYWEGTELEKYLVEPKVDNPIAIAKRAERCIKEKEKIIRLYKNWKKDYDGYCELKVKKFLEITN